MKYRNISRTSVTRNYCGTVLPLRVSASVDTLKNALKNAIPDSALDIILDDEEIKLMKQLLDMNEKAKKRDLSAVKAYLHRDTSKEYSDMLEKRRAAANAAKIKKAAEVVKFFEDRQPEEKGHTIEPKKLEGKPKSLADILNHNAALN